MQRAVKGLAAGFFGGERARAAQLGGFASFQEEEAESPFL